MSASQDKKRRTEERGLGTERRQIAAEKEAKERRKSKRKWVAGTIAIVLLLALIIVGNSNLFYTQQTAVKIGDTSYSIADVNYYYKNAYYNFYNNYYSYISYFGLDTSKALDEQEYTMSDEYDTWRDYFLASALDSLTEITALYQAAQAAGVTLSEEEQASVDSEIASIESSATEYGYSSVNKYLAAMYGYGVTEKVVRSLMEQSALASAYAESQYNGYTYTDEEIKAAYAENANDYDTFNYMYYLVSADKVESTDDEGNTTSATTDETMAAAQATAEQIAAAATDADSFTAAVAEYGAGTAVTDDDGNETGEVTPAEPTTVTDSAGSNASGYPFADWLYDSARAENDVTTAESEDSGYYVVLFQSRAVNDYNTVSVRHILIQPTDSDDDSSISDEEKATAETSINEIYDEWKSGDATEESFAALANEKSEDTGSNTNGGLYENIYKGQMVTEFNDWCFDESRQSGDTGIVYNENTGYHLIYFVGEGELYCDYLADQLLRGDDYDAWEQELLAGYTAEQCHAIRYVK